MCDRRRVTSAEGKDPLDSLLEEFVSASGSDAVPDASESIRKAPSRISASEDPFNEYVASELTACIQNLDALISHQLAEVMHNA